MASEGAVSDTREVSGREKLTVKLLTMSMSMVSTGTKNPLLPVVRNICGVASCAIYSVDISEGVS